ACPPPSSFFRRYAHHRDLPSFPTRRSSDLVDVHRPAVRGERDPGELAPLRVLGRARVLPVAGQRVHLAAPGDAVDVLGAAAVLRSEEHTSELQSRENLVCRLLLEKKKTRTD